MPKIIANRQIDSMPVYKPKKELLKDQYEEYHSSGKYVVLIMILFFLIGIGVLVITALNLDAINEFISGMKK